MATVVTDDANHFEPYDEDSTNSSFDLLGTVGEKTQLDECEQQILWRSRYSLYPLYYYVEIGDIYMIHNA